MNLTLSYIARYAAKRSGPKLGKITPETPKIPGAEGTRAITMPRGGSQHGEAGNSNW